MPALRRATLSKRVMTAGPVLAYVGLGANLGDTAAALQGALRDLSALPGTQLQCASAFYRTAPIDAHGPDYLNAVAAVQTTLAPEDLLA